MGRVRDWFTAIFSCDDIKYPSESVLEAELHKALEKEWQAIGVRERVMWNGLCAIRGDTCTKFCVHFRRGVADIAHDLGRRYVRVVPPSCKLWKS